MNPSPARLIPKHKYFLLSAISGNFWTLLHISLGPIHLCTTHVLSALSNEAFGFMWHTFNLVFFFSKTVIDLQQCFPKTQLKIRRKKMFCICVALCVNSNSFVFVVVHLLFGLSTRCRMLLFPARTRAHITTNLFSTVAYWLSEIRAEEAW